MNCPHCFRNVRLCGFRGEVSSPDLFIKVIYLGEVMSSPAGSETERLSDETSGSGGGDHEIRVELDLKQVGQCENTGEVGLGALRGLAQCGFHFLTFDIRWGKERTHSSQGESPAGKARVLQLGKGEAPQSRVVLQFNPL